MNLGETMRPRSVGGAATSNGGTGAAADAKDLVEGLRLHLGCICSPQAASATIRSEGKGLGNYWWGSGIGELDNGRIGGIELVSQGSEWSCQSSSRSPEGPAAEGRAAL